MNCRTVPDVCPKSVSSPELCRVISSRAPSRLADLFEEARAAGTLQLVAKRIERCTKRLFTGHAGLVRQAVFESLGISDLHGLDVAPAQLLEALHGSEGPLSVDARVVAIRLLRSQIERMNTFFLDVDSLLSWSAAVLVPEVIHVRQTEVLNACRNRIDSKTLATTYYGFSFLTANVRKPLPTDDFLAFLRALGVQTPGRQCFPDSALDYDRTDFSNTSAETGELLRAILRLTDTNSAIRVQGADQLGKMGDPRAVVYLSRAVRDDYAWVRTAAVRALGQIASRDTVQPLAESLIDFDTTVQEAAMRSLVSVGPSAVPTLIAVVRQSREVSHDDAVKAISSAHPRLLDSLVAALGYRLERARQLAACALGEIGDRRAEEALTDIVRSCDGELKTAASAALDRIRSS